VNTKNGKSRSSDSLTSPLTMRRCFLLLVLVLVSTFEGTAAFSTKPKHERSKRPAFNMSQKNKDEATAKVGHQQKQTTTSTNTAAFGVHPAAAAVAYGSYAHSAEEDDDELIGYGTAVVSCLLSLVLGFGLGYGT